MAIIIFIIVLGILVLVHELGHFLAAKKAGVQVEEFGFGYPPRMFNLGRKWGTTFSINWIPFGGFVKILGENYEEEKSKQEESSVKKVWPSETGRPEDFLNRSSLSENLRFTQISKKWQAIILLAGVTFNFIFAWFLFSVGFMIGLPSPVENDFGAEVKNPVLTITSLFSGGPAEKVGLKSGDKILNVSLENGQKVSVIETNTVADFINNAKTGIILEIDRGGQKMSFEVKPESGLVPDKKIIGINMDEIGTLTLPFHKSIIEGARTTFRISYLTTEGLFGLIKDLFQGKADASSVTGPIGIVGLVGDASRLGFSYLLTFTALISINLAIINLVPFPALDGGRLLFVVIEAITRRPINPKIGNIVNMIGFTLLIILMIFVTYKDILKII